MSPKWTKRQGVYYMGASPFLLRLNQLIIYQ
jgi:hypothetical protein